MHPNDPLNQVGVIRNDVKAGAAIGVPEGILVATGAVAVNVGVVATEMNGAAVGARAVAGDQSDQSGLNDRSAPAGVWIADLPLGNKSSRNPRSLWRIPRGRRPVNSVRSGSFCWGPSSV